MITDSFYRRRMSSLIEENISQAFMCKKDLLWVIDHPGESLRAPVFQQGQIYLASQRVTNNIDQSTTLLMVGEGENTLYFIEKMGNGKIIGNGELSLNHYFYTMTEWRGKQLEQLVP